jgi:DNA polymerase III alpha subunit (gram-positive type)
MSAGIEYYILDTETTGLSINMHEIFEISIIRCKDKVQISRTIRADNPKMASYDALKITNKTIQDLYKGISKQQAIEEINNFFDQDKLTPSHRCIVGHNVVAFDKRFLHQLWQSHNKEFPADLWLDTLTLSKKIAKEKGHKKPKVNLHGALDLFGIKRLAAAHDAKNDSRNNFLLWNYFRENHPDWLEHIKQFPHRLQEDNTDELLKELFEDDDE